MTPPSPHPTLFLPGGRRRRRSVCYLYLSARASPFTAEQFSRRVILFCQPSHLFLDGPVGCSRPLGTFSHTHHPAHPAFSFPTPFPPHLSSLPCLTFLIPPPACDVRGRLFWNCTCLCMACLWAGMEEEDGNLWGSGQEFYLHCVPQVSAYFSTSNTY